MRGFRLQLRRGVLPLALVPALVTVPVMLLIALPAARTQTADDAGQKNARQARAALQAMVQALGGTAWLNQKNQTRQGRVAAFFHGNPSAGATEIRETHAWPDRDRMEFFRHRDVAQFYLGRAGWEVTYKGRATLPAEQVDDFLRRRDHSIETVGKLWLSDPRTLFIYEGQQMVERHQADQVTVISPENIAVTILMDAETHLPLRRSFQWRDAVYHDMDTESEEYDDYHAIDGIATPFILTRYENGEVARQYFFDSVVYNRNLPPDFWSVKAAVERIKK